LVKKNQPIRTVRHEGDMEQFEGTGLCLRLKISLKIRNIEIIQRKDPK